MKSIPVQYSDPDAFTGEVWAWYEFTDEAGDEMDEMAKNIRAIHGPVEISWHKGYARVSLRIKKEEMKNAKPVKITLKKPIL